MSKPTNQRLHVNMYINMIIYLYIENKSEKTNDQLGI